MGKKFIEIVLLGDSISWSTRSPYGKRYADFVEAGVQKRLGDQWEVDVAACGQGGNTAEEGLKRIERDVISYDPDVVVINFGGNDATRAPSRETFMTALRSIVDTLRKETRAALVIETIPGLDPKRHGWRERDDIIRRGGPDAYLEAFANSFIRELAVGSDIPLHDRFVIFHDMLSKDPSVMNRFLRADGVHLTVEGNKVFGETLVEVLIPVISGIQVAPGNKELANVWLERARNNPVFRDCCAVLAREQTLNAQEEDMPAVRLLLQQSRSFARRAGVLARDPRIAREALIAERLAAGLLVLLRMKNAVAVPEDFPDNLAWAQSRLEPVQGEARAVNLLNQLDAAARRNGSPGA